MPDETEEDLGDFEVLANLWSRHFEAWSEYEQLRRAVGDSPTAEEHRQLAASWAAVEEAIAAVEVQMARMKPTDEVGER